MKSNFKFVGNVLIPRDKQKFIKRGVGGAKKKPMLRISFGIKENDQNAAFVEMFGMEYDEINTRDSENEPLTILWENRKKQEVLDSVAFYKKHIVDLGEEFGGRHEFITEYDTIKYLEKVLPVYNGQLMVTGIWEKNAYNGRLTDKFNIGNVYAVSEETKSKLLLTMDFYYNGNSVDMNDLNTEGKIYVNGYVSQYVSANKKDEFFPQTAVLSNAKYDMENEKHLNLWNYKKSYVEGLSKKKMYHLLWECRLVNGVEEVEFDESMLTQKQKEQIKLEIRSLDDFKPKGNLYGDKVSEVRLSDPVLSKDFADGILEVMGKLEDFEDRIFSFTKAVKLDDVLAKTVVAEEKEDVNESEDIDDSEDLF